MPLTWGHTFVTTDECLTKEAGLLFVRAINEKLAALGTIQLTENIAGLFALKGTVRIPHATGTIVPVSEIVNSAAGLYTITAISGTYPTGTVTVTSGGTPHTAFIADPNWAPTVGSQALVRSQTLGLQAFGPTYKIPDVSWKILQGLAMNLGAMGADPAGRYFGTQSQISLSGGGVLNIQPAVPIDGSGEWDFANWPTSAGFTRKREPEISALSFSTGYVNGDRARFHVGGGFCEFLGVTMPSTPAGEVQYSGKIMLRSGGAWIVDPDQATRISPLWTLKGLWSDGDLFGPWCLNDLRDAINTLDTLVWIASWTDAYSRSGTYNPASDTYANVVATVEANWTAAAEVGPTASTGGIRSYRLHGGGSPGPWNATIQTFRARVNRAGLQGSVGAFHNFDGLQTTVSSEVDVYTHSALANVASSFRTETYEAPFPLVQDQWTKFQTLGISNADVRQSNYLSDDTSFPTRPANPVFPVTDTEVGFKLDFPGASPYNGHQPILVQRFRVVGGFQYI